jgi:hypothetical protein
MSTNRDYRRTPPSLAYKRCLSTTAFSINFGYNGAVSGVSSSYPAKNPRPTRKFSPNWHPTCLSHSGFWPMASLPQATAPPRRGTGASDKPKPGSGFRPDRLPLRPAPRHRWPGPTRPAVAHIPGLMDRDRFVIGTAVAEDPRGNGTGRRLRTQRARHAHHQRQHRSRGQKRHAWVAPAVLPPAYGGRPLRSRCSVNGPPLRFQQFSDLLILNHPFRLLPLEVRELHTHASPAPN